MVTPYQRAASTSSAVDRGERPLVTPRTVLVSCVRCHRAQALSSVGIGLLSVAARNQGALQRKARGDSGAARRQVRELEFASQGRHALRDGRQEMLISAGAHVGRSSRRIAVNLDDE